MNTEKEYLIFCDESDRRGTYFSNFYGGLRIGASNLNSVNERLVKKKEDLKLVSEVKWEKTDRTVESRYEAMVTAFFDEIDDGRLVVRIMFTQNACVPLGLSREQEVHEYYLLYYQFLKHGFGLRQMPNHATPPKLRIYLDEIGDTREQMAKFRGFIAGLAQDSLIRKTGLILQEQDITEVRSHDHILMQCLDVVLGSISFRLNDKHKAIPEGKKRRGKRTIAKERLYRHIYQQICRVAGPRFNIGISTRVVPYPDGQWSMAYLHWLFKPTNHRFDGEKAKKKGST
ncbi:MAG TPA: DUF3800 domain-containing protein [Candidatus Paceibacterota bacterium]|nr:DUF3800 domain-containing protein [Verrucomicrobiota bacterium]HRY51564.1 DUF3800 domain-containing protein [Candidatus Paceibacterota bacterium]